MATGNYVFTLDDAGQEVVFTGDQATALIPLAEDAAFAIGAQISVLNSAAQALEIKIAPGVYLVSPDGQLEIQPGEAAAMLLKVNENLWQFKRACFSE